jgi:hypothetical protein
MNFLYPGFLFALFAIAVPIIIHLFNFRSYKTVYFSRVDLLKDIKQETRSRSNLKQLLILLCRILVIAAMVFAFAQPYFPFKQGEFYGNKKRVVIYIDNSFSAQTEGKYGKIIETAKKKALEIKDAYKDVNEFLFITNDFDPKHQHFVSYEQVKEFIIETDVTPSVRNLGSVVSKIDDICEEYPSKNTQYLIYLISDFQHSSSDFEKTDFNPAFQYVFLPLEPGQNNNLFIDSVWFESPERPLFQNDELFIRIVNKSDETYADMPLKLYINNQLKSTIGFSILPGSSIIQKITYSNESNGIINGMVEISDFPVTFDNTFYFNYTINQKNNVLIIDPKGNNKYFDQIFADLNYVNITYGDFGRVNTSDLENYQSIIINHKTVLNESDIQLLTGFVSSGGKLLVFIPENADFSGYNKLFSQLKVNLITGTDTTKIYAGQINYNSRIFKDVFKKKDKNIDFPYVLKRVKFSDQTIANEEIILASENNDKLISASKFADGIVYIISQSADEKSGNLIYHPIWVPMIYNMVIYNPIDEKIFFTNGQENNTEVILPKVSDEVVVRIINDSNTIDFIPKFTRLDGKTVNIFWNNEIEKAGPYQIISNDMILKGLSLNYDRRESDLIFYGAKDIKEILRDKRMKNGFVIESGIKDVTEKIVRETGENKLWRVFIILSLIFLLTEIVLIRIILFKKQS